MNASKVPDVVHRAGVDGFGLRTFNRHDHPCVEQQPPAHFHRRTTERRHNGAIAARTGRRRISEQLSDPTEWTVCRSTERHCPHAAVVRSEVACANPMRHARVQIERHTSELTAGNQDDADICRTGSGARCRRAGWKFDAWEDGEGCNDRRVLDQAPLHADEEIAGSRVETA